MIGVVNCTAAHIAALNLSGIDVADRDIFLSDTDDDDPFWDNAKTLIADSGPVACFGAFSQWPTTCRVWTYLSEEAIKRYPKSLHKFVKQELMRYEHETAMTRVEATVLVGYDAGVKWIERLGFTWESTMRKYGPNDEDFHLYVKFS